LRRSLLLHRYIISVLEIGESFTFLTV